MAGIYIHIPFCASFCTYCGFYSEVCLGGAAMERYADSLLREMHLRRGFLAGRGPIKTVYFGGGTPSLLPAGIFEKICAGLRQSFDLSQVEEFTV